MSPQNKPANGSQWEENMGKFLSSMAWKERAAMEAVQAQVLELNPSLDTNDMLSWQDFIVGMRAFNSLNAKKSHLLTAKSWKFSELLMFEFMTQRPLAGETLEASAPATDPGSSPATWHCLATSDRDIQ